MKKVNTKTLAGLGLMTAVIIVLQLLGGAIRFGTFSVSLVLLPIVVGAALYGAGAGAFLGLIFGAAVLLSGDATLFLGINPVGAVIICLLKGALAGLCAGLLYKAFEKKNPMLGTVLAAVAAPVVNTGVFLLGCSRQARQMWLHICSWALWDLISFLSLRSMFCFARLSSD